jgi:hypothetical protein
LTYALNLPLLQPQQDLQPESQQQLPLASNVQENMLASALTCPKLDAAVAMEPTPVLLWVRVVLLLKVVAMETTPVLL